MDSKLRNQYYQIPIGEEGDEDPVWVKKLKLILDADIHEKPLGCKIVDTHIKIGEVHMGAFYEAQILFSHARWIRKFSEWLNMKIGEELKEKKNIKNVVIIGYETYIEPVLYTLKQKMEENSDLSVYYGIYEEPKFIQNKAGAKTETRVRYVEDIVSSIPYKNTQIFFVCGISSTLSTLRKMKDFFWTEVVKKNEKAENSTFYTLIQVLPSKRDNIYKMSWEKEKNKNIAKSDMNGIAAQYLVSVVCDWYEAEKCPLCFPENPIDEKPIIQTSETSIVPIQMIAAVRLEKNRDIRKKEEVSEEKFDFFIKKRGKYKYKDYLYYNHIDRMDHHYKYYIRTGHLLKKVLKDKEDNKKFKKWCEKIQKDLETQEAVVNIIISPSHFSDEVFPNVINNYVFGGKAHMISFDPKKEYRSNFETKYSNIAYFTEQVKRSGEKVKLKFYYVDDQMVSGDMFFRVKSLVKSLMSENYRLSDNIEVFDAVIIFLSRISNSSKMDYVKNIKRYYSFVDIEISSIRNYGDSCPICKLKQDSMVYTKASSLDVCTEHWSNKYWYFSTKTLSEVKKTHMEFEEREPKKKEELAQRHFRRMECENILYEKTKKCSSKEDYVEIIIHEIMKKETKNKNISCEYLISFIKAIAYPFLYYKENEKKAAMSILLNFVVQIKDFPSEAFNTFQFTIGEQIINIQFNSEYEKYSLITVLINCLAEIDSTYLLNVQRIRELCCVVSRINEKLLGFETVYLEENLVKGFFYVLVNACKRIICGISGDSKIKHMDEELKSLLECNSKEKDLERLWRVLYLENKNNCIMLNEDKFKKNITVSNIKSELKENSFKSNKFATVEEYSYISNMLKEKSGQDKITIQFLYYDNTLATKWFYLCIDEYDRIGNFELNLNDLLNEMPVEGVKWGKNECIIRLHYFDIEGIAVQKENKKEKQNTERKKDIDKDVFLYIKFDADIAEKQLWAIRNILKYRYELCKKIAKDISVDAIKVAIQAKASEDLLKSDKAISHGAAEELSLLIIQSASLIESYWVQKNDKCEKCERSEEEKEAILFFNACNGINIFMNRCIGYSNTHQIIQQYFTPQSEKTGIVNRQSPFYNSIQSNQSDVWEQGWEFFEEYLQELENSNSKYLQELIKKRSEISSITVTFKPSIDEFANTIRQADAVPFLLNAGGAEVKYSMIFLIGILDVFLRNAIKHGVVKNGELYVEFDAYMKDENGQVQYKIEVKNEAQNTIENTGISKKFFSVINEEKMHNADNYFEIDLAIRENRGMREHIASLNIVKSFWGSECN